MSSASPFIILLVAGQLACATPIEANSSRLLKSLRAEHERIAETPPERLPVAIEPIPSVDVLVGLVQSEIRATLGEPDHCGERSVGECVPSLWAYDFSRVPSSYRGGGVTLHLEFADDQRCAKSYWVFQR